MSDQSLGLIRETLEQFGYASQEEGAAFAQGEMACMKFSHSEVCVHDFHREILEECTLNTSPPFPFQLLVRADQFSSQLSGNTSIEKPVYHLLYACNHFSCTHGCSETEPNSS